jgi:hypothetical protein
VPPEILEGDDCGCGVVVGLAVGLALLVFFTRPPPPPRCVPR